MAAMAGMLGSAGGAAGGSSLGSSIAGGAASGAAGSAMSKNSGSGQGLLGGVKDPSDPGGTIPQGMNLSTNLATLGQQPNHIVNLLSNSGSAGNMPALPQAGMNSGGSLVDQMLAKLGQKSAPSLSNDELAAKARADAGH